MENKILIIDEKDNEYKLMIENISKFKWVQEQLKSFKEWEKKLKDSFKQYDFNKVVITSESGNTTFSVTQYTQQRKELDKEDLVETLKCYIKGDLGLGDFVNEMQIPLTQDLTDIIEKAHKINEVKCIKYGVK